MRSARPGHTRLPKRPDVFDQKDEDARAPSRRARRKKRVRADKDQFNRYSQWRSRRRKDSLRGERTQAAFAATGLDPAPSGNLQLQAWFPAIPLDVYLAVLQSEAWQNGWRISPATSNVRPTNSESVPGEQLVAHGGPSDEESTSLFVRFTPEEGGTRLHLLQQGLRAERIPATTHIWQRVLFAPLAARFSH